MATATLKVSGMSCGHCVKTVKEALENTAGVTHAIVDLAKGRATVDYDDTRTSPRALASIVSEEGYTAEEAMN